MPYITLARFHWSNRSKPHRAHSISTELFFYFLSSLQPDLKKISDLSLGWKWLRCYLRWTHYIWPTISCSGFKCFIGLSMFIASTVFLPMTIFLLILVLQQSVQNRPNIWRQNQFRRISLDNFFVTWLSIRRHSDIQVEMATWILFDWMNLKATNPHDQ